MSTPGCDHKFVDSTHCLKCGWTPSSREAEIAARLKAFIRKHKSGGCRLLSQTNFGDCQCPLCDVDDLLAQLQQAQQERDDALDEIKKWKEIASDDEHAAEVTEAALQQAREALVAANAHIAWHGGGDFVTVLERIGDALNGTKHD